MIFRQSPPAGPAQHGERLSNWLALLALLACGIPWAPAHTAAPAIESAGSLVAGSAAAATSTEARPVTRHDALATVARVKVRRTFSG